MEFIVFACFPRREQERELLAQYAASDGAGAGESDVPPAAPAPAPA